MDIVNRIKTFMNLSQISSSQFADTCNIPRPTISQILNGRNKKISDEIISKIHSSYPSLSMLWLMFGEGDMLINSNIKISEPLSYQELEDFKCESTEGKIFTPTLDINFDYSENNSENLESKTNETKYTKPINAVNTSELSFIPDSNKTIVNILVFYSDNSFESFTPAQRKI